VTKAKKIQRLLIANRGEIAVRVARAADALGIETVALFAPPDEGSLHVVSCTEAEAIDGETPSAAYLDIERILAIAKSRNCDAIHPGYGFLSENPGFAQACAQSEIIFVGPSPETISSMGKKIEARELMGKAEVPVIPGATMEQDLGSLHKEAQTIGFPLLIKASAGGGGKGMRRVDAAEELEAAVQGAQREAQGSFGDSTVYLERLVTPARHVEVQIVGDAHGDIRHVGTRDCSAQRRYQKVVEEAPAPGLPPEVAEALHQAALKAARAVDYVGAGTVEFIVGPELDFYFLEMNTRLQVEHPVTEEVYGVDLVNAQLRIAMGEKLEDILGEPTPRGVAFECRIYAEDPANNFLPSPGPLLTFIAPEGPGIRVDTGVRSKDDISPFFDPMIAKIVAYGPTRQAALARMGAALKQTVILGTRTNLAFLADIIKHPEFIQAAVDTGFLAREFSSWTHPSKEASDEVFAAMSVHGALWETKGGRAAGGPLRDSASPWKPGAVSLKPKARS